MATFLDILNCIKFNKHCIKIIEKKNTSKFRDRNLQPKIDERRDKKRFSDSLSAYDAVLNAASLAFEKESII